MFAGITVKIVQGIQWVLRRDYAYFSGSSFFDNELLELKELVNETWQAIDLYIFHKFKALIEMQLKLIPETINAEATI